MTPAAAFDPRIDKDLKPEPQRVNVQKDEQQTESSMHNDAEISATDGQSCLRQACPAQVGKSKDSMGSPLGISNQMPIYQKGTASWLLPVKTEEESLQAIKSACHWTFALASIQGVIIGALILYSHTWTNNILDPFLLAGLAWILRIRKSRVAAVVLITYCIIFGLLALAASMVKFNAINLIFRTAFIYASYKAVQGTFSYHRAVRSSVNIRNVFLLTSVIFLYVLLYTLVLICIFRFTPLASEISTVTDMTVGFIYLILLLIVILTGVLRKLPLTKRFNTISFETESERHEQSRHYIARHWRGELPLATSYWVNLFLFTLLYSLIFKLISNSDILERNGLLRIQAWVVMILTSIPLYIWQLVGCWRSAINHEKNTGKYFWPRATQVILVISLLYNATIWAKASPAILETVKVATRTDQFTQFEVNVLANGKEIEINGYMAYGLEKELERVLADTPNAYLIRLNSLGGRLEPARKIRDLIEDRNLSTYTATECDSAALIPFMAGQYRILNTKARLGFHEYSFPGSSLEQMAAEMDSDKRYFQSKGIDAEFLDKAYAVNSKEIWFPSIDELIQSKVITHTFDGKNVAAVSGGELRISHRPSK